ncbi:hypothetical protein OG21DRAFT_1528222 [Imleria badia]|nr:hypothetical protein OG21DRAFT_1528222 [Imleria badia]
MSPRRTREKNATTHPGAIVLASQGKRLTKAEKKADEDSTAAERAAAEKAKQEHVITIAKMVMELQAKEQNAAAPEVQAPKAPGSKHTSSSSNKKSGKGVVEQGIKHQTPSDVQVVATSMKPKKATKASLKAMISEASKTIAGNVHGDAVKPSLQLDENPNLSQYLKKKSLSGTVKGWATLVHEKSLPKDSPGPETMPSVSAFGALSSQAMKVDTPATTSTQYSVTDGGITTKFGGFDLNSENDNNKKKKEIPFKNREGKSNNDITLVIPSAPDSDVKIEGSQILPWYPSTDNDIEFEASQIPPWYSPGIPSTGKRKKRCRRLFQTAILKSTSHQTLVNVTMEDTQPVAKKAKTEAGKETQVETCTTTTSADAVESKKTRTVGTESKSRSDYKNSDLPIPADHRWTNVFMDTAILWAGGQANVWSIPNETLATALQKIFTTVYPEAWQCLLEWCSGFGSTALVMVLHFFWEIIKDDAELKDPNAMVQEIAKQLISPPHFPFTHEDYFILKLIATTHLSKTITAVDIQSLETAKLEEGYGTECVVTLVAAADAVKEMAEKKGKITLLKTFNKATGNMSKGMSMFSMSNWGSKTQLYAILVTKKGPENTADIIASVHTLLDCDPTNSGPTDTNTAVDLCTLLWYFIQKHSLYGSN